MTEPSTTAAAAATEAEGGVVELLEEPVEEMVSEACLDLSCCSNCRGESFQQRVFNMPIAVTCISLDLKAVFLDDLLRVETVIC